MRTIVALLLFLIAGCSIPTRELSKLENPIKSEKSKSETISRPTNMPSAAVIAPALSGHNPSVLEPTRTSEVSEHKSVSKQLHSANIAYSIPGRANVQDTIKIQLLIDPQQGLKSLLDALTIDGTKVGKNIKISKVVIAKVTAPEFIITEITPSEQAISDDGSTEWLWSLEPKSSGKHQVNLSITAVVTVGDQNTVHHLKTYDTIVDIEITSIQILSQWWDKYWQWVISTLLLPLGLWAWKKKFDSRKNQT